MRNPIADAAAALESGFTDVDGEEIDMTGWSLIRANAFRQRPVVRLANGDQVDIDEIEVEAYAGRWARVMVRPAVYENEQNGVKFWLDSVQLLKHDTKLAIAGMQTDGTGFGAVEDGDEDDPLG